MKNFDKSLTTHRTESGCYDVRFNGVFVGSVRKEDCSGRFGSWAVDGAPVRKHADCNGKMHPVLFYSLSAAATECATMNSLKVIQSLN